MRRLFLCTLVASLLALTAGSSPSLTAVLTASLEDSRGLPRLPCLLTSLARFATNDTFVKLVVVVPDTQKAIFYRALVLGKNAELEKFFTTRELRIPSLPFPVEVIGDSSLLSASRTRFNELMPGQERKPQGRGVGYRLQMLLKLGVAQVIDTEYYITLDLDVFMTRPTAAADLVVGGKGIIQGEMPGGTTQHNQKWWKRAEQVLKAPSGVCYVMQHDETCNGDCQPWKLQPRPSIGVTPAVLSVAVTKALLAEIEELHQIFSMRWDEILFALLRIYDWTEYTLYWTYACKHSLVEKYHTVIPNRQLYSHSGFELDQQLVQTRLQNHVAEDYFSNDHKHIFGVVQTISGVNPLFVVKMLTPFLRLPVAAKGRVENRSDSDLHHADL